MLVAVLFDYLFGWLVDVVEWSCSLCVVVGLLWYLVGLWYCYALFVGCLKRLLFAVLLVLGSSVGLQSVVVMCVLLCLLFDVCVLLVWFVVTGLGAWDE